MDTNLAKYLAFVKTADTGSFTKAAWELNYSQSSVSKMIADLESECGTALLLRSRSGTTLTPSGEKILPLARKLINDHRKLEGVIDQMNGLKTGTVKIGTFASMAINRLPDVFARLQKDFPGIDYEMQLGDYAEIERWIEEGRVDCGFLSLPTENRFDVRLLDRDEYKVVLPTGHPLTKNDAVDIKELDGLPFLLLEHGGKTEVTKLLEQSGVRPDIRFTTWEDYAILAMVEKGLGVSILPSLILQRIPYTVGIRPLKKPFYREIVLAVKSSENLTPAARKFIEYL